ncbi:hypothetical protein [Maribacter sp. 2307ULW6-5]|uniref:hypothetical protein n=1 Tax=Maribacter sp. 2307ULW6-5 TaxID=3386275 RepID=UPI0039BC8B3D
MKNAMGNSVGLTTVTLILVVVMATLDFPYKWVFFATVIGQGLLIWMVYSVLTDNYKTNKTFEDFYEDAPIRDRSTP